MSKIYDSFDQAVADIQNGASIMLPHINVSAIPENLILALREHGARELALIVVNLGFPTGGYRSTMAGLKSFVRPSILLESDQIRKVITTWPGVRRSQESEFEEMIHRKQVEIECVPFGVLVQRIRAGGSGLGAFYSPVGINTIYEKGKEKRTIAGKEYILEYPLRADYGFIRAYKADKMGNLVLRGTSRCVNPSVARACDVNIAEVDDIVEIGEIDPEDVVIPSIYIDRIVKILEVRSEKEIG